MCVIFWEGPIILNSAVNAPNSVVFFFFFGFFFVFSFSVPFHFTFILVQSRTHLMLMTSQYLSYNCVDILQC